MKYFLNLKSQLASYSSIESVNTFMYIQILFISKTLNSVSDISNIRFFYAFACFIPVVVHVFVIVTLCVCWMTNGISVHIRSGGRGGCIVNTNVFMDNIANYI